ncbi:MULTISPECIES: DEAD/DEAH box helicase family protein [Fusobacterium]|uniref:DEAD/DEAH box helicase family protein n=1 Tax=Fusobacterium TaxID=848 RepID=UPI001476BBC0|nr:MULTISPECIES: DEAD/DEAH box helicase family protein [Fusobacterium]NME35042.1 DEAD/DEAH box helicase family protein [Fusobacterium sp. FSA-380-WT-3A]
MGLISNTKINMYNSLVNSISNSEEIIMNVSFVRDSGIKLLISELLKARDNGKSIKILISDYMKITEPNALYRLLDIKGIKILHSISNKSFHPKAYIFKKSDNKIEVYIGSSNISYSALVDGIEWNYHFLGDKNSKEIQEILDEFQELYENKSFYLTLDWLRKYEKQYKKHSFESVIDFTKPTDEKIEPIKFQIPALYELAKTREEGYKKALIVVGTGLGKTFLSAFDSQNFNRILFIAHRDEILKDAYKTFKKVYGDKKTFGFFNGDAKDIGRDILFASVYTIGKDEYLTEEYFLQDYFDYIVVDEFHHSTATTYSRVLKYFKPKFLLGLTATPDRADNGDIYKLCDYNIAYECDFKVGINNGWLTPFEYYGIYDDTDYEVIPWRNGNYDLTSLENSLIVEKRLNLIYEKYILFKKKFAVGFCAGVRHCKIMSDFFNKKGIKNKIILGETPIEERQQTIEDFKSGKIDIIFTVDVFNEGVDIPCIDTVLFLRPTSSYTIFIQQLGRGLRTYEGKTKLRVLDFVGNYRGAELKTNFLMGNSQGKRERIILPSDGDFILPEGCTANFDMRLIDYFSITKNKSQKIIDRLISDYNRVKEYLNHRPSIMDIHTFGEYPVNIYLQKFKSWYNFQKEVDDLTENQKRYSDKVIDFLLFLEKTPMTKSYKIPLLLCFFKNTLPEIVSLKEIGENFKEFYSDEVYRKDLNNKKHENLSSWKNRDYEKLALTNPIKFLTENVKNREFFIYENDNFILNKDLYIEISNDKDLLGEILERLNYRNINYFRRKYMED